MKKKFWLVALVSFVFLNVWGFAIYGGLLANFIKKAMEGVGRAEGLIWPYFLRSVGIALVLAFMYPKGYEGKPSWREGFNFGLLVAILLVLYSALDYYAMFPIPVGTLVVMYIPEVIGYIILGIIIGALYGKTAAER